MCRPLAGGGVSLSQPPPSPLQKVDIGIVNKERRGGGHIYQADRLGISSRKREGKNVSRLAITARLSSSTFANPTAKFQMGAQRTEFGTGGELSPSGGKL